VKGEGRGGKEKRGKRREGVKGKDCVMAVGGIDAPGFCPHLTLKAIIAFVRKKTAE